MAKLSKMLKVYKVKHSQLGEVIELYSPMAEDGTTAYFVIKENGKEKGAGIRLSKSTALKLSEALAKLAKELP